MINSYYHLVNIQYIFFFLLQNALILSKIMIFKITGDYKVNFALRDNELNMLMTVVYFWRIFLRSQITSKMIRNIKMRE